jgi:hypothetical protein
MTYIPTFLNTLSFVGSNALQSQAKDVYEEFASGRGGDIARKSFASLLGTAEATNAAPPKQEVTGDAVSTIAKPDDAQMEKFHSFNIAYDETIGFSATGYTKRAGGYYSEDQGIASAAAAVEFKGLFEETLQQQGLNPGKHYSLTTDMQGTLLIKGSGNDAAINAYLKDKYEIQQSFSRISFGFEMQQIGKETVITNDAYMRAAMKGGSAMMARVVDKIMATQFKTMSLSFDDGEITPLFGGKTSQERLDWLTEIFKHLE